MLLTCSNRDEEPNMGSSLANRPFVECWEHGPPRCRRIWQFPVASQWCNNGIGKGSSVLLLFLVTDIHASVFEVHVLPPDALASQVVGITEKLTGAGGCVREDDQTSAWSLRH